MIRSRAAVVIVALLVALAGCAATPAPAVPGPPVLTGPTAGLAFMAGRWEGSGWAAGRDGRREFVQTEQVAPRLGGQLLTVDGDGHDRADPTRPVHAAFAVVDVDPATRGYRWVAYSQGARVETPLLVDGPSFRWSLEPTAGIVVRFTASFGDGDWHEVGETSRDAGRTWSPTLDMRLHRTG